MKACKNFATVNAAINCVTRSLSSTPVMPATRGIAETVWSPMEIFEEPRGFKHAVVILNRPILLSEHVMMPIWKEASIKITVDGGTDRWFKYLGPLAEQVANGKYPELVPNLITGDFDSILPESLEKLRNLGVSLIRTYDQNYTDFSKALIQLAAECKTRSVHLDAVYIITDNAGRFDQIIANVNTLYKSRELMSHNHVEKIILLTNNSLIWLLRAGKHRIKVPDILHRKKSWIGLIPFGGVAIVTTTGLKWNLSNSPLTFGGMVSTSNTHDGSAEVTITTDSDIIWSMGIEPLLEMQD